MNLGRAVGSTDYTDCTDWKLAEEGPCFTIRLRADTDPGRSPCSSPSVQSVKSVDSPTAFSK
jgi:hypothetical protein